MKLYATMLALVVSCASEETPVAPAPAPAQANVATAVAKESPISAPIEVCEPVGPHEPVFSKGYNPHGCTLFDRTANIGGRFEDHAAPDLGQLQKDMVQRCRTERARTGQEPPAGSPCQNLLPSRP